jgi:hypothetical protein
VKLADGVDVVVPDWLFEGDGLDPLVVGNPCDREVEVWQSKWRLTEDRRPHVASIGIDESGSPRIRIVGLSRPGPTGDWVGHGFFVTDGPVWLWVQCDRSAPLPPADAWVEVHGTLGLMYWQMTEETFDPARDQAGLGPRPGRGAWIVEELIAITPEYHLVRLVRPVD